MKLNSILVLQTAFLGDLLLAIPLLKNLRRIYPNAKISLVCRGSLASLIKNLNLVDHIYEIKKNNAKSYKDVTSQINASEYDCLLSLHDSVRTHLFIFGLKIKYKIGFYHWWNQIFFHHRIKKTTSLPEPLRVSELLCPLNLDFAKCWQNEKEIFLQTMQPRESCRLEYKIPNELSMHLDVTALKPFKKDYIIMAPGSVWATKRWTQQGFIEVADFFLKKDFEVVLLGAKEEESICNSIAKAVPEVKNICGKTELTEALRLIAGARLLVSNDSGPMHMAAVANCPNICIFGPTSLDLGYRPWQNNAYVIQKDITCRPCGKHGHEVCPIGTHECMVGINANEVIQVWEKYLNANI